MDFTLSEEHRQIQATARQFAREVLAPIAIECDREQKMPVEAIRQYAQLGFMGAHVPTEYGGGGLDSMGAALVTEEVSRVMPGFPITTGPSDGLFAGHVMRAGNEAQKRKYLPPVCRAEKFGCWGLTEPGAGSDALGLQTSYVKDGDHYILNGQKTFISLAPVADFMVVIAREKGTTGLNGGSAFILERGMPGLTTGPKMDKMGLRCSPTGQIFMDNVRVHKDQRLGEEGAAFLDVLANLNSERVGIAVICVGSAQGAFDIALKYAQERKQFGKPIALFQAVGKKLARMQMDIELGRTYAHKCVWMGSNGMDVTLEASVAKIFCAEMNTRTALEAVQILGGNGYMTEFQAERYVRDAKLWEIGGGTTEIQEGIMVKRLLGKI